MATVLGMSHRNARDESVIAELRAQGGRTTSGHVLVIMTFVGARTGRQYQRPVCVREDGDDLVVPAASAGGQANHPQWYYNLTAHPEITVEYLGESYRVAVSTVANGPDRDRLFGLLSQEIKGLYEYQDRCRDSRQIPVVRLRRILLATGP
jgi:deazaflavin-dependent oxidoreductase (nitroreductase family)